MYGIDTARLASKKLEDKNAKQNEALDHHKSQLDAAKQRLIVHQRNLAAHERDMAEAQKKIPQGLYLPPTPTSPSPSTPKSSLRTC